MKASPLVWTRKQQQACRVAMQGIGSMAAGLEQFFYGDCKGQLTKPVVEAMQATIPDRLVTPKEAQVGLIAVLKAIVQQLEAV